MKPSLWKNWGIGTRLIVLTIIPVAFLFCSDILYTLLSRHVEAQQELAERGRVISTALAESSEYGIISGNLKDLQNIAKALVQADSSIHSIDILKADKSTVLHVVSNIALTNGSREFMVPVKRRFVPLNEFDDQGMPHLTGRERIQPANNEDVVGFVRVAMTPAVLAAKQNSRVFVQFVMSCLALMVSLLCAWLLVRALHTPIRNAIVAVREIRGGQYAVHIDDSAGGDLGELLTSINEMSVSLAESKRTLENKVKERTRDLEESRNAALKADGEKRKLIQQVNKILEDERKSIAVEIHDVINAILIGIRSDSQTILNSIAKTQPTPMMDDIVDRAKSITMHANDVYKHCRAIVTRLRPEVLDVLGLEQAMEELVQIYMNSHPACKFTFHAIGDASSVDPAIGIAAYRIAQEALSNIVKHSRAEHAEVSLRIRQDELRIAIEDDGQGFTEPSEVTGFGIIGMRERAVALGGTLQVQSAPDANGARVIARIPLPTVTTPAP